MTKHILSIATILLATMQGCRANNIAAGGIAPDSTIAFPGAEGFGKYTTGGRGGKVYIVSNLNDNGPGSFREAVNKKERRYIVFSVSGNITLQSPLNINAGDVTIAGQSAPGDGICIKNYPVIVNANNVIIRFLRFRLGDEKNQEADAFGGTNRKSNIIIDHCSISWATDECASFYRNRNFTFQWCIVSESLNHSVHQKGDHGYGGIWGGEKATFHHNLIASHNSRLPRFSGSSTTPNSPDELVDFRNNVIYNWMGNCTYGGEKGHYNIVNNYYKPGPATKSKKSWMINPWAPYGSFYISGNYFYGNEEVSTDNWKGVKCDHPDSARALKPFTVEAIQERQAEQAFNEVLERAGASLHRDAIDTRVTEEARSGKSSMGKSNTGIIDSQKDVGGWPELRSLSPFTDTDTDGMPDEWEKKNGLNSADNSDANKRTLSNQYDNLEIYLNELVKNVMN